MNSITVTVIKDEFDEFPGGYPRAVPKDVTAVRVEPIRMRDGSVRDLLYLVDKQARKLWVDDTLASFNAKLGTIGSGAGGAGETIDVPADGTTVTYAGLDGKNVIEVSVNDNSKNTGFTKPLNSTTLTFTDGTTVVAGQKITFIYGI